MLGVKAVVARSFERIHRSNLAGMGVLPLLCRIDTPVEVDYYRHGGILPYVLRALMAG